jgi:hypothetical protein
VTALGVRDHLDDKEREEPMRSGNVWFAPVRNLVWVAAHFGHR